MLTLGIVSILIWLGLMFAWHGFWRTDQRLPGDSPQPERWPHITALVPARNEADVIGPALRSLLAQDYPGQLDIVVINDSSSDETGIIARRAGGVRVIDAPVLGEGWAGKLWALQTGYEACRATQPDYYWLSDADIVHGPQVLRHLTAHSCDRRLGLASLMVRLRCSGFWEKLLVPAFIFHFQLLYPFRAANDPSSRIAGSAGGCVLIGANALDTIGGFTGLKGAIIDDCTLARHIKRSGAPIWVGLADSSRSLRGYDTLGDFWAMVARSAFTQLRYSWGLLALCIAGLGATYAVPVVLVTAQWGTPAGAAGVVAWALMAACYLPTIRYHGLNPSWALSLPLAAVLFGAMTIDSARRHAAGAGVVWKDRAL